MVVVVQGEGEVEDVAQRQRLLGGALGHAPRYHLMGLVPAAVVALGNDPQLKMLFFQDLRSLHQLRLPADKNRQRIAGTVRLQLLESLPERLVDVGKRQLSVIFEYRHEVSRREPLPREDVEP